MEAKVIEEKCIGCGSCVSATEQKVFDYNDEGFAHCILDTIPEELESKTKEAIENCPTEAIIEK